MINPAKIDEALAKIDKQRKLSHASKLEKIVAEVEEKVKDPFELPEQIKKLDLVYQDASKEKKEMYAEIKSMLSTALAEYTAILMEDVKEVLKET